MYKTKLQEICHQRHWTLPTYSSSKDGPDHRPRFKASVVVNGRSFDCPSFFKSSKEAQNEAARVAYEHHAALHPALSVSDSSSSSSGAGIDLELLTSQASALSLSAPQVSYLVSSSAPQVSSSASSTEKKMYKTKLQEICHQRHWTLPIYSSSKDGPDHQPRFKASVVVNGRSFDCPNFFKSSKEAQNEAARIAYQHHASLHPALNVSDSSSSSPEVRNEGAGIDLKLITSQASLVSSSARQISYSVSSSAPQVSSSASSTGSSSASTSNISNCIDTLLQKNEELSKSHQSHEKGPSVKDEELGDEELNIQYGRESDAGYVWKSQLQKYMQKRSLGLPVYSSISEGPSHAPRFKAMVTVEGQTFESPEFCRTLKEAEQSAAKVALSSFTKDDNQEDNHASYKSFVQILTQKEGLPIPVYTSIKSGASHIPTFTSTVEVAGKKFHGGAAKTKKQAEMLAAKVAYLSLKERERQRSTPPLPLSQFRGEQDTLERSINSLNDTLAAVFQQKLNFGYSPNSTPAQGCQDSKDGDQKAESAERITNRDKANANHQTTSPPRHQTGFERLAVTVPTVSPRLHVLPSEHLQVTVPSVSSTVQRPSSSTFLDCPDPPVTKPNTDLPEQTTTVLCDKVDTNLSEQTTTVLCDKVVVYPREQYMKIQHQEGTAVMQISDEQWIAVSLHYPN